MKLAREMQADYEIDDFDVAQVERTAEDRRGFEAVDLAGGWDQALVFGSDGQPGEQVAVLAAGRGEVGLERAGAVPGPGEAALEGIQKPEAAFGLEDHVAEGGGEQRGFGADADPLPRFQSLCELLGREGSRQFHRMITSVPAAVLTKPSGRDSTPGAV